MWLLLMTIQEAEPLPFAPLPCPSITLAPPTPADAAATGRDACRMVCACVDGAQRHRFEPGGAPTGVEKLPLPGW